MFSPQYRKSRVDDSWRQLNISSRQCWIWLETTNVPHAIVQRIPESISFYNTFGKLEKIHKKTNGKVPRFFKFNGTHFAKDIALKLNPSARTWIVYFSNNPQKHYIETVIDTDLIGYPFKKLITILRTLIFENNVKLKTEKPHVWMAQYMTKSQQIQHIRTTLVDNIARYIQIPHGERVTHPLPLEFKVQESILVKIINICKGFSYDLSRKDLILTLEPLDVLYRKIKPLLSNVYELTRLVYNWKRVYKPFDQDHGVTLKTATYVVHKLNLINAVVYNCNIEAHEIESFHMTSEKQYIDLTKELAGVNFRSEQVWLVPYVSEDPEDWDSFTLKYKFKSILVRSKTHAYFFPLQHALFDSKRTQVKTSKRLRSISSTGSRGLDLVKNTDTGVSWYLACMNQFKFDKHFISSSMNGTFFGGTTRFRIKKKLIFFFSG